MTDIDKVRVLVTKLSAAEAESLDKIGPITGRLHDVIKDLCKLLNVPNVWNERDDNTNVFQVGFKDIKTKTCPTCYCVIVE